jgi:hypothetical protein
MKNIVSEILRRKFSFRDSICYVVSAAAHNMKLRCRCDSKSFHTQLVSFSEAEYYLLSNESCFK